MKHVTRASSVQLLGLAETCDFYAMKESIRKAEKRQTCGKLTSLCAFFSCVFLSV
jgi:hypothetical protein